MYFTAVPVPLRDQGAPFHPHVGQMICMHDSHYSS